MREIEFRGKTTSEIWGGNQVKDGTWVYGFYRDKVGLPVIGKFEIDRGDYIDYEIDRNTLGQYTGRVDRNIKKIFEGDLVYFCDANHDEEDGAMLVIFKDGEFAITGGGLYISLCECYDWELEVVGNKFDNPELLEVDE